MPTPADQKRVTLPEPRVVSQQYPRHAVHCAVHDPDAGKCDCGASPILLVRQEDARAYADARVAEAVVQERERATMLAAWLQWCLDNCDDSAEWNFGTYAAEQMRRLLAGGEAAMPPRDTP